MKLVVKFLIILKTMLGRVNAVFAIMAAAVILIVMFDIMVDVTARMMSVSIQGLSEFNTLLVAICIYLGVAFTQKSKRHITIGILTMKLSTRTAALIDILVLTVSAVFFAWTSYLYYQAARTVFVRWDCYEGIVRFPMFPTRLVMFVGISMLTIQLVFDITKRVLDIVTPSRLGEKAKEGKV